MKKQFLPALLAAFLLSFGLAAFAQNSPDPFDAELGAGSSTFGGPPTAGSGEAHGHHHHHTGAACDPGKQCGDACTCQGKDGKPCRQDGKCGDGCACTASSCTGDGCCGQAAAKPQADGAKSGHACQAHKGADGALACEHGKCGDCCQDGKCGDCCKDAEQCAKCCGENAKHGEHAGHGGHEGHAGHGGHQG